MIFGLLSNGLAAIGPLEYDSLLELTQHTRYRLQRGLDKEARDLAGFIVMASPIPDEDKVTMALDLLELARLAPFSPAGSPDEGQLSQIAEACNRIAMVFYENGARLWANELLAVAYSVLIHSGRSAYAIATKMVEYADRTVSDQYAYALWRFATEQVRVSLTEEDQWLLAIDAVEIALAFPPTDREAHIVLSQDLGAALYYAEGTPLEPLMNAVVFMGDLGMDEKKKVELMERYNGFETTGDAASLDALEWTSIMQIQLAIDNARFAFLRKDQRTALTWHDLSLSHMMLHEAVPIGSAITADINRTAGFLLELAHEIAHAYSLVGTIGKTRNVLRVTVHSCELLMRDRDQNEPGDTADMRPAAELPQDPLNLAIARVQFVTAWKTAVLEATWRPWLEGVAMYFELLCDPSEAPTEIFPVHEAIRSLIDINLNIEKGEEYLQKNRLLADEIAAEFDQFFSKALQRLSRLSHGGYVTGGEHANEAEKDIYLTGYLLVRAVISRWETTLGRRLLTVEAGKLLLHATRGDANDRMLPRLTAPVEDFAALCQERFMQWIRDLGALDKATLTAYMPFVAKNEPGRQHYWEGGKLYADLDGAQGDKRMEATIGELHSQSALLIEGLGMPEGELDPEMSDLLKRLSAGMRENLILLTERYWDLQTLLPVGKTMSKVNRKDKDTGRVMISTRSYIGDPRLEKVNVDARERYSIRVFELNGGKKEAEELVRLMAEQRLARVLTTKVIDLLQHGRGPLKTGPMAYTCYCIRESWRLIFMMGYQFELNDDEKGLKDLIIDRLYPSFYFFDEINNLSSFRFLSDRLRESLDGEQIPGIPWDFDGTAHARRIGLESCATAFGSSPATVASVLAAAREVKNIGRVLGTYLYETGSGGTSALYDRLVHSVAAPWMAVFADPAAFSGIKSFKL